MFLEFASETRLLFLVDGRDDLGIFVGSIAIFCFFFLNLVVEYIIVYNKWFEFTDGDFIISVRLVEILYFFYHDSYYL